MFSVPRFYPVFLPSWQGSCRCHKPVSGWSCRHRSDGREGILFRRFVSQYPLPCLMYWLSCIKEHYFVSFLVVEDELLLFYLEGICFNLWKPYWVIGTLQMCILLAHCNCILLIHINLYSVLLFLRYLQLCGFLNVFLLFSRIHEFSLPFSAYLTSVCQIPSPDKALLFCMYSCYPHLTCALAFLIS